MPMIKFESKEEFIEFVIKLEKIDHSINNNIRIEHHFVINNPQLFPCELEKFKRHYAYPLNEYNIHILYSLKDKFYNGEKPFIEWMKKYLSPI